MDIQKIKKIIQIIESSSINEIEIHEGKKKLRMRRFISKESDSQCKELKDNGSLLQDKMIIDTKILDKKNDANSMMALDNEHLIRSPMVGIFYSSVSPEIKPFVSVGQKVSIGDVVCIIEAMKIMNHIQSDRNGIVQSILIENGQPVEFNEPLIIIK